MSTMFETSMARSGQITVTAWLDPILGVVTVQHGTRVTNRILVGRRAPDWSVRELIASAIGCGVGAVGARMDDDSCDQCGRHVDRCQCPAEDDGGDAMLSVETALGLAETLRSDGLRAEVRGDSIVFAGGAYGEHSLYIPVSSRDRVMAHWNGYVTNNGRSL